MSTTVSDSTIHGKYNEVAGKIKQAAGEAVGNHKLANEGTAQQLKGHAEQAWGSVKEAAAETAVGRAAAVGGYGFRGYWGGGTGNKAGHVACCYASEGCEVEISFAIY